MSINVYRTFKGESGTDTSEVWKYIAEVPEEDAIETTISEVLSSAGLPANGELLSGTSLRARRECTRRDNAPHLFDITINWEIPQTGGTNLEPKPESGGFWNVEVSSTGAPYQEEVFTDVNGLPMLNSAGDRYPSGVMLDYYDEEYIVSFNTDTLPITAIAAARGKLNAESLTINVKGVSRTFAPKTVKLINAPWKFVYDWTDDPSNPDFSGQIVLHYRSIGWKVYKLDEGLYEIGTDGKAIIKDAAGDAMLTRVLLDGAGHEETNLSAAPTLVGYDTIQTADFSFLEEIA